MFLVIAQYERLAVTNASFVLNIIQFDELSMCEVVNLQLTLEPNQTITVPIDILTENTMVAYEANTYMAHTPTSIYTADQYFDTPLQYLNFSSTVTKVGGKCVSHSDFIADKKCPHLNI